MMRISDSRNTGQTQTLDQCLSEGAFARFRQHQNPSDESQHEDEVSFNITNDIQKENLGSTTNNLQRLTDHRDLSFDISQSLENLSKMKSFQNTLKENSLKSIGPNKTLEPKNKLIDEIEEREDFDEDFQDEEVRQKAGGNN